MKALLTFLCCAVAVIGNTQSYVSYFTGNEENVDVQPEFGVCLMGGAGESDEAMIWFLERANGGDVVVIRTSGADGYNDYMYSDLGVNVNSVETIVFESAEASTDPYVVDKLNNAEAIWMAGGDQSTYVDYWKDTPVSDAINNLLNEIGGPVGGISAGCAVMGQGYFGAVSGTITEEQALANPFNNNLILGYDDFIHAPFMENVITETHTNDPDRIRYGRIFTFIARLGFDQGINARGMAPNEYCAIAIGEDGLARAFGEYPEFDDDFVYFLQPNCENPLGPEILEENEPITWDRSNEAVKVYKIPATPSGTNYFDLNDWNSGEGGSWENWYAVAGELTRAESPEAPDCVLSVASIENEASRVYPNPAKNTVQLLVESEMRGKPYRIFNAVGQELAASQILSQNTQIDVSAFESGIYFIQLSQEVGYTTLKFVKE